MDLVQIIQLFKRNLLILLAVPIILAGVTYYFTRNQQQVYQSEAVIYTGITTGYSIESTSQRPTDFFSISAQFDNMINLLNSRQTIVETALQLLAQDLSLENYNRQYISSANFDRLQVFIPKRVKDLVVKNNKSGIEREKEQQIKSLEKEIQSLEKEISKKKNRAAQEKIRTNLGVNTPTTTPAGSGVEKGNTQMPVDEEESFTYHVVQQGESLSELASRYGVSRGQIMSMNNMTSGDITPGQSLVIRKTTPISKKYHTVKAGETLYSIAKKYGVNMSKLREVNNLQNRSLSPGQQIIIDEGNSGVANTYEYDYAVKQVSPTIDHSSSAAQVSGGTTIFVEDHSTAGREWEKDPIIPPGVNPDDFAKTLNNLTRFYNSSDSNFIYGLLHYGMHPHYSIRHISNIQIYRINNSDLVRLTYTSDDPGICQQTLKILSQVFMKNYKLLRANETDLVVKYFERQVDSADKKLKAAEDRLLKFNKKNNIINYYEQSKYIAAQKEDLDLFYQNEQIRLASSSAALKELELNLTARDSIYLKSDEINQLKKELAEITESIVINDIAADYDQRIEEELVVLRKRQQELRNDIKLYVDQLYLYSHTTQGMPIKTLLDEWLNNTIAYEEARAALVVLARRKMDFVRTYQKFAPLGAMLTRIEREIKVAEQAYLELLRSLNLAKMKQQNEEMATNVKIVDAPYFPIQANPSRAKFIIVAAAMFGFVFVLFVILVLEYFDTSMKSPSRVAKATGMKLGGAYPHLGSRSQAVELSNVSNRLVDIAIQNIKMAINSKKDIEKPYLVLIFSSQDAVGKSLLSQKMASRLRSFGDSVLMLNYEDQGISDDYNYSYNYKIKDNFIDVSNLQELMSDSSFLRKDNKAYDYIFLEIPSIIYNIYPIKLINQADLSLYVIKANSKLTKADKTALATFDEVVEQKPFVVLNEVELYNLEEFMTDVQKRTKPETFKKIKTYLLAPFKYKVHIKKEG